METGDRITWAILYHSFPWKNGNHFTSPAPTQVPPRSPTKARMKKAANLEIPTSVIIFITSSLLLTKEALTKNYLLLKYKAIFKKIYTYIIYFN